MRRVKYIIDTSVQSNVPKLKKTYIILTLLYGSGGFVFTRPDPSMLVKHLSGTFVGHFLNTEPGKLAAKFTDFYPTI